MAVLPMKRVFVCALKKDRKPILEMLQRLETVQIENREELPPDDPTFAKQDKSESRSLFEKNCQTAAQALSILDNRVPEKKTLLSSLEGRKQLSVPEFDAMVGKRDEIMATAGKLIALDRERAENAAAVPKVETQIIALEPWLSYDLPLNFTGTRTTTAFTGTLQNEVKLETVLGRIKEFAPEAEKYEVRIISATPEQTCIFIICSNKDAEAVQDALRKMSFAKPPLTSENPARASEELKQELQRLKNREEELNNKIASYENRREDLKFAVDYFTMRAEKYNVLGTLSQSSRTFLIDGYIPAENTEMLEKKITGQYDAIVEFSEPGEDEDVPVLLKNNAFAEPVEPVVESYSMPGKGEIDPSFIVACFYYVLFGIMLSDAAYGIILFVVCGLLVKKYKNMEPGMRKLLMMFCFCGIGTTVFGFLFGSFFGDSVNIIATVFFKRPDIRLKPLWMDTLANPMKMLLFCFIVGIIHLFTGLGAKMYMLVKDHKYLDALYDVISWYMVLGGCIVLLDTSTVFTNMMGIAKPLPSSAALPAEIIAAIGAVIIILFGGRESRNWFKRLLKGLYALYGISGYLSDVLSYSRLLALGLATGVIAQVFNKMGSMLGGGIVGGLVFILVFLIGHILNILINVMGSYVHTNRLTFVEFFGKFYGGGGRKFAPFAVHTKYYKIKEDI